MRFKASEDKVRILGRTKYIDDVRYIDFSCSGVEFEFIGTSVSAYLCTDKSKWEEHLKAWVAVFIDDETVPSKRFPLDEEEGIYKLYDSEEQRRVKIRLVKISETAFAKVGIKEIIVDGEEVIPTKNKEHRIEFIGDSITCGYGIEGIWNTDVFNTTQENPWEAYAAKSARYFDADFNLVSWSGIGIISSWTDQDVPNTSEWLMPELYKYTDGALDKALEKTKYEVWDNKRFEPQLIIINLGTNDASYTKGIKERVDKFSEGYYNLLKQVRDRNPKAEIICALGVMGQDLSPAVEAAVTRFRETYSDNKIHRLVFDVQLESDGIGADWHPSLKTHEKMSEKLIEKIKKVMKW